MKEQRNAGEEGGTRSAGKEDLKNKNTYRGTAQKRN